MTSRIISFFRMFPRGQAFTAEPNSWATIVLWRRFFEMKHKEEDERIEETAEIMEEILGLSMSNTRPSSTNEAKEAREQFVKQYYRDLISPTTSVPGGPASTTTTAAGGGGRVPQMVSRMRENEERQLNRPNLSIPVGDEYMTLAQ